MLPPHHEVNFLGTCKIFNNFDLYRMLLEELATFSVSGELGTCSWSIQWHFQVENLNTFENILTITTLVGVGSRFSDVRTLWGCTFLFNWPAKLIMQLIPKTLVQTIGGQYFRNSKSVLFHPSKCDSLDSLTNVMVIGVAGRWLCSFYWDLWHKGPHIAI